MGFPHINVRNVAAFSIKSQLFLVTKGWPWSGYHRKDGRNGPVPVPRAGHCCTSGETGPGKLAKELKRLGHLLKYPPAPHRLQVSVEINYFRSGSYVKSIVFYSTAMKYDFRLGKHVEYMCSSGGSGPELYKRHKLFEIRRPQQAVRS